MMAWLAASLLVAGFILLLKPFRVIDTARTVMVLSQQVMHIIGDKTLTDLEKEKAMQRRTLDFLRCFVLITLGGAAALLLPLALVWGLDRAGLVSLPAVLAITLHWPFLLGASTVGIVVLILQHRSRSSS